MRVKREHYTTPFPWLNGILSEIVAGRLLFSVSMSLSMIYGSYSDTGNSQTEKYDYYWLITLALMYRAPGALTGQSKTTGRRGSLNTPSILIVKLSITLCWGADGGWSFSAGGRLKAP